MEPAGDGRRQGTDRERLGQTGNSLEQDMTVGQQPDEQSLEHSALADEHVADFPGELGEELALFRGRGDRGLRGCGAELE